MTRAEQWAAMWRTAAALTVIAVITLAASIEALRLGPAAAGLLYLLPVLWVSARAGLGAGSTAAGIAAFSYNYFLLAPRFTLSIRGVDDVAAFFVLFAVAIVTSRLAAGLRLREIEAKNRALDSEAEAEFTAMLAKPHSRDDLDRAALGFLTARYGDARLVTGEDLAAKRTGLAPLDASAAAWTLHNGDPSGHASAVMPSADYRFVPLTRGGADVLALAATRTEDARSGEIALKLARIWTQARDRLAVQEERQAREAAEQREHVRRALLAALGHDFRTPLTVLKSELAALPGDAPARLGIEVDRITRLTEDLIAAARIESGGMARLEPVDLVDIVPAAVALYARSADRITIRADLPDDLPLVRADPVMLNHLIGNLIDNACRHAHALVTISAEEANGRLSLEVGDDGDGIEASLAGAMFDRFVTGSDRSGGSGLGLSIARDLAQAMGGALSGGDAEGGGARFTLLLPLQSNER